MIGRTVDGHAYGPVELRVEHQAVLVTGAATAGNRRHDAGDRHATNRVVAGVGDVEGVVGTDRDSRGRVELRRDAGAVRKPLNAAGEGRNDTVWTRYDGCAEPRPHRRRRPCHQTPQPRRRDPKNAPARRRHPRYPHWPSPASTSATAVQSVCSGGLRVRDDGPAVDVTEDHHDESTTSPTASTARAARRDQTAAPWFGDPRHHCALRSLRRGRMQREEAPGGRPRIVIVGGGFGGLSAARSPARRASRRHADRPDQPLSVPAAALPGGDRRPVAGRHRDADPFSAASATERDSAHGRSGVIDVAGSAPSRRMA